MCYTQRVNRGGEGNRPLPPHLVRLAGPAPVPTCHSEGTREIRFSYATLPRSVFATSHPSALSLFSEKSENASSSFPTTYSLFQNENSPDPIQSTHVLHYSPKKAGCRSS